MTEPASSGLSVFFWAHIKVVALISLSIIIIMVALTVVIMSQMPSNRKEWTYTIVGTFMSSVGGGSLVVMNFGLQHWVYDWWGIVALITIIFACGLPGNAMIRWTFVYMDKNKSSTIVDVVKAVAGAIRDVKSGKTSDSSESES